MATNGLNLTLLIAGISNARISGTPVTMALRLSDGTPYEATVPAEVLAAFADVLSVMDAGSSAVVVNGHRDLTTTQAAEILSMSRTSLRAVIDSGELPAHMRGSHFRLRLTDVLEFRRKAEFEVQTGEAYALLDRADAVTPQQPRETPAHVLAYRRRLAREQKTVGAAAAAAGGGAE